LFPSWERFDRSVWEMIRDRVVLNRLPDGLLYHEFRYNVANAWERPVEEMLVGSPATLPPAPITEVPSAELPRIIFGLVENTSDPWRRRLRQGSSS
jgi:hypothetical protein